MLQGFFRSLAPIWDGVEMAAPVAGVLLALHLALLILLVALRALGLRLSPLWTYMGGVAGAIEGLNRRIGLLAGWLALIMVGVEFTIVVISYVFSIGFIWLRESVVYMHAALFLLAAAYTLQLEGHVRVDVFFREAGARQKAITDFLGSYLFLMPMMALIAWVGYPYVVRSWASFEGSKETSGIQAVYLLKTLIVVFAGMMLLQAFACAYRAAQRFFDPGSAPRPAIEPEV